MARQNRTPAMREYQRSEIARRCLRHETQAAIAQALGITRELVEYDVRVLKRQWRERAMHDTTAIASQELAALDVLEAEYWAGWDRSKGEKTKTKTEKRRTPPVARPGRPIAVPVEDDRPTLLVIERDTLVGDPRFLDGVLRCQERRAKLLGLDAPEKHIIGNVASRTIEFIEVGDAEVLDDRPGAEAIMDAVAVGALEAPDGAEESA